MFCPNCGKEVADNNSYCPICGHANVQNNIPTAPVYNNSYGNTDTAQLSKSILVKGILAIAFACTFWLSFLGIVFGAMTKNIVNSYLAKGNSLAGKSKVGYMLGKAGFVVGIVLTVVLAVYIIVLIAAAASM
ncbi:MAG: zinc-ribbon domain-containing protein [Bacteroidales bacterium]|nr:zinc-ribbon domain-containing protein [Bacteroidales bacterium]